MSTMGNKVCVLALGIAILASLPQCGSSYSDHCEALRSCSGGNDQDVDACIEQLRAQENVASAYDCGDAWDSYEDCITKVTACTARQLDTRGCATQLAAVGACQAAASGRKSSGSSSSESSGSSSSEN